MKAVIFEQYGAPEVLHIREIQKPEPKANEVLVRIEATAVNSGDVRLRKADPFAVRFMLGLTRPKINVLGGVFSGRIEAVGQGVTRFNVGDEVFGSTDMRFGAYAEYRCFPESGTLAMKPVNLSHEQAAVLPFGGTTALYFLRKAKVKAGQKVLIYGASGAVGTAAVQLACEMGAEVTAVCSTSNVELVKSLGANRVLDYTQHQFEKDQEQYDVIYDTVNKAAVALCFRKLRAGGILILGAAGLTQMLHGAFKSMFGSKKVLMGMIKQTAADIDFLKDLAEKGTLKPVIDKSFTLEQIAEAHRYVEAGHKKGNVAITIQRH